MYILFPSKSEKVLKNVVGKAAGERVGYSVRNEVCFATIHTTESNLEVGGGVEPQSLVLVVDGDAIGLCEASVLGNVLDCDSVVLDPACLSASHVLVTAELGEAPLVGSHNLLPARELELGTTKCLDNVVGVGILGAHGDDDIANGDTRSHFHGLTVRSTHTR